jgi:hypothetical protein
MSDPGNLWTRSHGRTQRSAGMRQAPGDPVKTSANIERFAEALDLLTHGATDARLVSGETEPRHDEQDLAGLAELAELIDTATRIHLTDGVEPGDGDAHAPVHLEMERKQSIWEEVMRSQREAKTSTGDSRSITSVVNGWSVPVECVGTGPATAHLPTARQRPSPAGWFRTRIDIQPVVTTLLVAALIVAIVAGYRGFGGGSGSLVTPTASAHGNPELAAIGSPKASPATTFACDVSGTPVARDVTSQSEQSESYGYENRGPISKAQTEAIPHLMTRFAVCMEGPVPDYLGLESIGTERFVTDLRQAVGGTPADTTAIRQRSTALSTSWEGPLPASEDPERVIWKTSNGTPEVLNMFLGTAQRLEDGRIGFLVTIAPEDVAPIPDQVWQERNDTAVLSVWFIGLEQTDAGLRVDEMFGMCGGGMCVSSFGADAATPEASREASREASPAASPVASAPGRLSDAPDASRI